MEMRGCVIVAALAALLTSCGSNPAPPAAAQKVETPKPPDESRHLPKAGLLESHVVDTQLLGKKFMPGGTMGHYKVANQEFDMFLAKMPSPQDAAFLLPDWSKALANSALVPSFGGYFGDDAGKPVFVFSKGNWIAGVAGLPQKDADLQARALAGMLN
jgi:hypothetical protein